MANEVIGAKYASLWLGALFFWIVTGFKGSFSAQLSEEKETWNGWVGYIIQLSVLGALVYAFFIVKNMQSDYWTS